MKSTRDGDTKKPKREKFDFEKMKSMATHKDAAIRKQTFIAYFEQFGEFPSYLFDNERQIDEVLKATVNDILADAETSKEMRKGIDSLLLRLPSSSQQ